MKYRSAWAGRGFTVVELVIVVVVVGILATVVVVAYRGMQEQAAVAAVQDTAKKAAELVDIDKVMKRALPSELPAEFTAPDDVEVTYSVDSFVRYSGLTPVQNGVLFHAVCVELIEDPYYSTVHAKSGGATNSVVYDCDTNINDNDMMINGWTPKTWHTPVTKAAIEAYIASVPSDSWWVDKQTVIRAFYTELMNRYTRRGGAWPITSFWEPNAIPHWGIPKEELPTVTPDMRVEQYCVEVAHRTHVDVVYHVTSGSKAPREGRCGE